MLLNGFTFANIIRYADCIQPMCQFNAEVQAMNENCKNKDINGHRAMDTTVLIKHLLWGRKFPGDLFNHCVLDNVL